ncbi:hypothetical protein BDV25DRAFT_146790 [Aspergillus avenaceus]|uniref:ubiquitinyl hydrolase 1 n=1 Tax=Aspergillus avenaceus TaxID=36643 RepID=A0A5N6U980_ASPAV|nr:hypothetical protein BDV25DRAFT_146790 [Aspergillus avenaceus]
MNSYSGRLDILTQSPFGRQKNSHYDTLLHYLQDHSTIVLTLAIAIFVYTSFNQITFVTASIARTLWNILIYITPSRIIVALDSMTNPTPIDVSAGPISSQMKSEAMQRILGVDSTSLSSLWPRTPAISGLSTTTLLGSNDSLPPGLGNWDNSCYQNSVIQGFASLQSLEGFLSRNIVSFGDKEPLTTHQALQDIITQLNSTESYGQRLWTPADLKSMSSWQQQDAQEYFSKVVDQIDYELKRATRGLTRNLGLKMASPQEHVIGANSMKDSSSETPAAAQIAETCAFRNPLEGLLAQRVGCMRCGWTEGLSFIPFNCLTVPLSAGYEHHIRDCLRDYTELEPIEGVECGKCTLLRAQDQLYNLFKQIEQDDTLSNTPDSSTVSAALKNSAQQRLKAVEAALAKEDFTEKTLSKKCHIPAKSRVASIKTRQAVIARPPKCLVVHINRSLFDEMTGMLRKNYAAVKFPKVLDLREWCLGATPADKTNPTTESWELDPRQSMLPYVGRFSDAPEQPYELRAVITHYGRHENGHYICYRKYPSDAFPAHVPEAVAEADGEMERPERWFRLSDEDVQMVSESNVLAQEGAFMLFYEDLTPSSASAELGERDLAGVEKSASTSSYVTSDGMSTTSAITENSLESRATSVSATEKNDLPVESTTRMTDVD